MKEIEGNPEIKQRQRNNEKIVNDKDDLRSEADVVVTNPTHYAVALQ